MHSPDPAKRSSPVAAAANQLSLEDDRPVSAIRAVENLASTSAAVSALTRIERLGDRRAIAEAEAIGYAREPTIGGPQAYDLYLAHDGAEARRYLRLRATGADHASAETHLWYGIVRCTNPACQLFQRARYVNHARADGPCARCDARVGSYSNNDLLLVHQPQPGSEQVVVHVDRERYRIESADRCTGVFGLVLDDGPRHGDCVDDDPMVRYVLFIGDPRGQ